MTLVCACGELSWKESVNFQQSHLVLLTHADRLASVCCADRLFFFFLIGLVPCVTLKARDVDETVQEIAWKALSLLSTTDLVKVYTSTELQCCLSVILEIRTGIDVVQRPHTRVFHQAKVSLVSWLVKTSCVLSRQLCICIAGLPEACILFN